jgi:leucyl aminopeptidase
LSQLKLLERRLKFLQSAVPSVKLEFLSLSEFKTQSATSRAQNIDQYLGGAADGVVYPIDIEARHFLVLVDLDLIQSKNSLDNESPGGGHLSALLGGKISGVVFSSSYFREADVIAVSLSPGLRLAVKEKVDFLVAAEHQSINNRLEGETKTRSVMWDSFFEPSDFLKASALSDGMLVTRSLINWPANLLNPATYESFVGDLLKSWSSRWKGQVSMETLDSERLVREGAGLISAVGRAAKEGPRILKLVWSPEGARSEPGIALVGKGITYDTGGLDIKPGSSMRLMKKDMGGSAAVLGSFLALALSGYKTKVTLWLPLAENAISGDSFRPGDVYKALNGKLVEIDNTDAEGRLILADALVYAAKDAPKVIIDVATLTGAARVALGPEVDSAFTNRRDYIPMMQAISLETGDWVWPMPRVPQYRSYFETSNVADMENGGGKFAGAIVGALFLEHFVGNLPWIHVDSYMWAEKPTLMAREAGANPKMVRFLCKLMEELQDR